MFNKGVLFAKTTVIEQSHIMFSSIYSKRGGLVICSEKIRIFGYENRQHETYRREDISSLIINAAILI